MSPHLLFSGFLRVSVALGILTRPPSSFADEIPQKRPPFLFFLLMFLGTSSLPCSDRGRRDFNPLQYRRESLASVAALLKDNPPADETPFFEAPTEVEEPPSVSFPCSALLIDALLVHRRQRRVAPVPKEER